MKMNTSNDPAVSGRRESNGENSVPNHVQGSIAAQSTKQVFTTSATAPRNSRPNRLAAFFQKEKRIPNRNIVDNRGDYPFHPSCPSPMSTPIRFSTTSIDNSTGSNPYYGNSHFAHACSLAGNPIFRPTADSYGGALHTFGRSNIPVTIPPSLVPLMNDETFPPLPKAPVRTPQRCSHPLDLPEMLLQIMEFVADSNDLYKCLLVNRIWKICATKVLWTQAKFTTVEKATLFLSMFDTGTMVKNGEENTNEQRVEPLAVLSMGSRRGSQRPDSEISSEIIHSMRPFSANKGQSRRRNSARKREGKYEDVSGPPHIANARRMRKIVFYKLKSLGSALLITAASRLNRLTSLEFYICDMITTAVVSEFAKHCPNLKDVRVPGCGKITDESIIQVAANCPRLQHLDVRACSLISDVSIVKVAHRCPELLHINVGRISGSERITYRSVSEIAAHTKVDTLGLAGCDITDNTVISIAMKRASGLERVSFNNCPRITDAAVEALAKYCPRLAVLEIKECLCISNFSLIWQLLQKRVLVEMCGTGKARLELFQRAELAKIKFGNFT